MKKVMFGVVLVATITTTVFSVQIKYIDQDAVWSKTVNFGNLDESAVLADVSEYEGGNVFVRYECKQIGSTSSTKFNGVFLQAQFNQEGNANEHLATFGDGVKATGIFYAKPPLVGEADGIDQWFTNKFNGGNINWSSPLSRLTLIHKWNGSGGGTMQYKDDACCDLPKDQRPDNCNCYTCIEKNNCTSTLLDEILPINFNLQVIFVKPGDNFSAPDEWKTDCPSDWGGGCGGAVSVSGYKSNVLSGQVPVSISFNKTSTSFTLNNVSENTALITLTDLAGREILSRSLTTTNGTAVFNVGAGLKSGLYIMKCNGQSVKVPVM